MAGCDVMRTSVDEIRRARPRPEQSRLEAVSEAATPEQLSDAAAGAAEYVGLSSTQLLLIVATPKNTPFVLIEAASKMHRFDRAIIVGRDQDSPYDHDLGDPRRDPVVGQVKQVPIPVVWDGDTYVDAGLGDVRDWYLETDRRCGITMNVPFTSGGDANQSLHLVVAAQRREEIRPEHQERLCADVALITMHAVMASGRTLAPLLLSARQAASPLTPAMRQYLIWAERGRTASETADIVGRKCSTIKNVLGQALERLDCSNKTDAIRLARANGWL
jgi:DNA-binding CsgD family transcriptional regulator